MQYYKRYRMECDTSSPPADPGELPADFYWQGWTPELLDRHAAAKFNSFRSEVDAHVFPCLGDLYGCIRLMQDISAQPVFLPEATWLIGRSHDGAISEDCGTIQGLRVSETNGSIQNVGVVPHCRGMGLGKALVAKALQGFHQVGVQRVFLEVTASNVSAIRLYTSLGFHPLRTMYRPVPKNERANVF